MQNIIIRIHWFGQHNKMTCWLRCSAPRESHNCKMNRRLIILALDWICILLSTSTKWPLDWIPSHTTSTIRGWMEVCARHYYAIAIFWYGFFSMQLPLLCKKALLAFRKAAGRFADYPSFLPHHHHHLLVAAQLNCITCANAAEDEEEKKKK